jgi:hypothetical protein
MIIQRFNLLRSVSAGLIILSAGLIQIASATANSNVDESNVYRLQLMTQIFDGHRDFSHSQLAAVARVRTGDVAHTLLNFGNSTVVIEKADGLAASYFENTSEIEAEFIYNYATKTLSGQNQAADFFNTHARKYLQDSPELGSDVKWDKLVSLRDLDVAGTKGAQVNIKLTRDYFTHEGKDYVLLHYQVPAFSYTSASGQKVIQWGEGIAVSDPGFGEIYWNASLQRAVATEKDGTKRPYRYAKTLAATDKANIPLIDPRAMDAVRPYFDQFYGQTKTSLIGFVDAKGKPDQTPITMAANLDVMALSLAEGSANQTPQTTSQYTNGNNGTYVADQTASTVGYATKVQAASKIEITHEVLETKAVDYIKNNKIIAERWTNFENESEALAKNILTAQDDVLEISEAIETERKLLVKQSELASTLIYLEKTQDGKMAKLQTLVSNPNLTPAEYRTLTQLQQEVVSTERRIISVDKQISNIGNPGIIDDLLSDLKIAESNLSNLDSKFTTLAKEADEIASITILNEAERKVLIDRGVRVSKGNFTDKLPAGLKNVIDSKAAKLALDFGDELLTTAGDVANIYTTLKSGYNAIDAATSDQSSGDLNLVRSYGTAGSVGDLGLDIGFLFWSAATGDVRGTISDGIAITAGSVTDIYVSLKGLRDVNQAVTKSYELQTDLQRKRTKQLEERSKKLQAEWDKSNAEWEKEQRNATTFDKKADAALQARLKERAALRASKLLADEQLRIAEEKLRKRNEYIRGAKQRFEDAFKPKYPTAKPRDPNTQPEDKPYVFQGSDIPDWLLAQWDRDDRQRQAKRDLDKYQAEIFKNRDDARAKRDADRAKRIQSGKENPITFEPVVWTSVFDEVEPVEWSSVFDEVSSVVDEFSGFSSSIIDFTQFDGSEDDNWLGFANVMSFKYQNMSGIVETDLSKYKEFIALNGLRKLERLALQAGYPNLASALNDWEYLTDRAADQGFRQWANRAPVCYMACVNIQGLWTQKLSQLALGDLLQDSRDIFSTAGLSDISISGFLFSYLLRDFGLEDGDIVDVVVQQFGRNIFQTQLSLLNAGTSFQVELQPGVASVVITAVNEGQFSPNTAEVRFDNVAGGESVQSYSLRTGETATLRVEPGK